jgi:hypothetical protein
MKYCLWIILFGVLVLIFFACGPGEETKTKVVTEEIDGVTYVHNPAEPFNPEKTVQFIEELSLDQEDADGNVVLYRPGSFAVDDRGYIYMAEMQDNVFKVFDREGTLVNTFGSKGGGPGEFQSISSIGFTPDGRFIVTDFQANRTSFFDRDGNFLQDFKWTRRFVTMLFVKTDSYVTTEYVYEEGDAVQAQVHVVELDFDGDVIRSYGKFTNPRIGTVAMGEMMLAIGVPQSPQSIFEGNPKNFLLYHCLNSEYRIDVYDPEGKLVRVIDRPYKPLPFTADEKLEFVSRFEESSNEALKKMVNNLDMPDVKTVTDNMVADEAGNLWVITQETREENGIELTAIDVFDAEGRYDTRVWAEHVPRLFKGGKMYRFENDEETGYRTLKRYDVAWD